MLMVLGVLISAEKCFYKIVPWNKIEAFDILPDFVVMWR